MTAFDHSSLKKWFLEQKRDFPWRISPKPYSVWVSEVMLQQTQASVVVPYFERWMELFPTINHLAKAELDQVIKAWEGLGYYSRARCLHAGARYISEQFGGTLPDSKEELQKIKGLGDYTIGAIRSFAFHHRTAAVDGNVLRVIARYFAIQDDISKQKTVKSMQQLVESLLPEKESWIINEGLIELGATICGRKPKCQACPLRNNCAAYREGITDQLPVKTAKTIIQRLFRSVAVISHGNALLVSKGEKGKIMSDLYEFPYFETTQDGHTEKEFSAMLEGKLGIKIQLKQNLPEVQQSFTRYRVTLRPHYFTSAHCNVVDGYQWLVIEELKKLAFSSGHRKIFNHFNL